MGRLGRRRGGGEERARLGGGVGTRGPGERKREEDRRRGRAQSRQLERELALIDELSLLLNKKLRVKVATLSQIAELLKKRYPDIKVIPHTEFPNQAPTGETAELLKLTETTVALLKEKGCDGLITGLGG